MTALLAICGVFSVLALLFLFRAVSHARRRRILRAGGSCVGCLLSATIAGGGTVLLFSYLGYTRLIEEQRVSRIEFTRISQDEFEARLMIAGKVDQFFVLRGDEWQMDARIVTWKPPMTVLGLDPIYQLDRLSGRYTAIDREKTEARTVHSISASSPVDAWRIARRFPLLMPGIDAHFGTATYVPMADGARFEVSLSRDALIARPVNASARDAIGAWSRN